MLLVLVLTSGFVVGTTATFTGTTTNAGNEFAAAALAAPPGATVEPKGNDVQINWTDATGSDSSGAGYRVSVADWQAAPNSVPGTCGLVSPTWVRIGVAQSGVSGQGYFDDDADDRANFTDGRLVCYQIRTSYPCCNDADDPFGDGEGRNPWLSQDSGSQSNPVKVANLGVTLVGFDSGNGTSAGTLRNTDWFEFTFNQPMSNLVTIAQFVCANGTTDEVWIGMSGTGPNCPSTTGFPENRDTTFSGFKLVKTSGTGVGTGNAKWAIAEVTNPACAGGAPPGCYKMRVTLGALVPGASNKTLSGTYKVETSSDPNYLLSTTGAIKLCGKSTTTTTTPEGLSSYTADPTNGKCIYTGHNFLGKI